jgi:hypothetical protein
MVFPKPRASASGKNGLYMAENRLEGFVAIVTLSITTILT